MSDPLIPQIPQRPKRPSKTPSATLEGENAPKVEYFPEPPSQSLTVPQPTIPLRPKRKSKEPEAELKENEKGGFDQTTGDSTGENLTGGDSWSESEKAKVSEESIKDESIGGTFEKKTGSMESLEAPFDSPVEKEKDLYGSNTVEEKQIEQAESESELMKEGEITNESQIKIDSEIMKANEANETENTTPVVVPPRPTKKTNQELTETSLEKSAEPVMTETETIQEPIVPQRPAKDRKPEVEVQESEELPKVESKDSIEAHEVEDSAESKDFPEPIEAKDVPGAFESEVSESIETREDTRAAPEPVESIDIPASVESTNIPEPETRDVPEAIEPSNVPESAEPAVPNTSDDSTEPESTQKADTVTDSPKIAKSVKNEEIVLNADSQAPKTDFSEPTAGSEVENDQSVPVIPTRPAKQPTIPNRPVKGNADFSKTASPSPAFPSRPVKPDEQKKGPPPKPKKLSSKIAAFQQMFNQPAPEAPKPEASRGPRTSGRLSSDKKDFASNLQNVMGRGIALPGMANPGMLQKLRSNSDEQVETTSSTADTTASASVPRRARGPKGKRLPKSIQESTISVESPYKVTVHDVWELEFTKKAVEDGEESKQAEEKESEDVEEVEEPQEAEALEEPKEFEVIDEIATGDIIEDRFESESATKYRSPEIITDDEQEGSKHVRSIEEVELAIEELRESREALIGLTEGKVHVAESARSTEPALGSAENADFVPSEWVDIKDITPQNTDEVSEVAPAEILEVNHPEIESAVQAEVSEEAPVEVLEVNHPEIESEIESTVQASENESLGFVPAAEVPDTLVTGDEVVGAIDPEDKDLESALQFEVAGANDDGSEVPESTLEPIKIHVEHSGL